MILLMPFNYHFSFFKVTAIAPKFSTLSFAILSPATAANFFRVVVQPSTNGLGIEATRSLIEQNNLARVDLWNVSMLKVWL